MKKILFLLSVEILFSCNTTAQTKPEEKKAVKIYTVSKTKNEWKKDLNSAQYYVLREAGTERPFTSKFNNNKRTGTYVCAACNTALYKSEHKFDSGTGWPSFDRAVKGNVESVIDYKIGYKRTELKCNTCGGHLGHLFDDGPKNTTGKRHCINGVAMKFILEK